MARTMAGSQGRGMVAVFVLCWAFPSPSARTQEGAPEASTAAGTALGVESVRGRPAAPAEEASEPAADEGAAVALPPVEQLREFPLSLQEAVRQALESNLQIQMTLEDHRISQRSLIVAKAVFDPFFNMGFTYAKNRDPSASFIEVGGSASQNVVTNPSDQVSYSVGLGGDWVLGTRYDLQLSQVQVDRPAANEGGITFFNPITSTRASLDLRQPLLKGAWYDVNAAEIRIARNNAEISREEVERMTADIVLAVEEAYWEVVFANQDFDSKQKALQVALENLDNVRRKHAVGTLAAIDVTTAESQVALRKVDLESARLLVATNRDLLLDLLNHSGHLSLKERWKSRNGGGGFGTLRVVCTTQPSNEPAPYDRDEALRLAFQKRPEYHQIDLNIGSERLRMAVARNDLLPSLDILGRWMQLGLEEEYRDSYSQLGGGRFYDWLVGVEFSVPLSNRGARSRYRNTRSEVRKLGLQKTELENQMVLEVDQALREIESLRARVSDLEDSVRFHELLFEAERRKLEVGKSVAYTVSTIENDLVEQETLALRAKADLQTAQARLRRVTGTLLDKHDIRIED